MPLQDPVPGSVVDARIRTLRESEPHSTSRHDKIAIEAPLEVRLGGRPGTVLMRTPGEDEDLVRGFLFNEGIIARAEEILALTRPPDLSGDERGNVIAVELAPSLALARIERSLYSSSSCGVCGRTSIASLAIRAKPSTSRVTVRRDMLGALPDRMRNVQAAFRETGGLHASGLFTPNGTLVAVREDVGRHNALDKLVGWALAQGLLPLEGHLLLVSGRVSYELVQKAVVAGLPIIAAVGAPSSLAVDLAEKFGVTLVGFLRTDSMNVYSHAHRIVEN